MIEPEGHALNWHIRHNRICDCHAWFSWDGVAGGMILIFGNVAWFTSRPGQFWDSNSGGKVFKTIEPKDFEREGADEHALLPSRPIHMFNNSWFLRIFVAKTGVLKHFHHYNNALVYCESGKFEPCTCKSDRQLFSKIRVWSDVSFNHDATDRPGFGEDVALAGQELDGVVNARFRFKDPARGKFHFKGKGVRGRQVKLKGGHDIPGSDWTYPTGRAPWCGAYQERDLIQGPRFVPVASPPEG